MKEIIFILTMAMAMFRREDKTPSMKLNNWKLNLYKLIIHIALTAILLITLGPLPSLAGPSSAYKEILEDRDSRWQIVANKMSYSKEEGLYVAHGDVTITRNGQTLTAEMAKYNEKTGIVEVTGNVKLAVNGDTMSGERGIFDLNNHQGQITTGRIFLSENHYYINGDVMERTGPKTFRVKNFKVTTCDGDKPDWSITGSEVNITVEGYGTVKNAVFRIKGFPVFYFPYVIFPAKTKRQTGFLPPSLGYSSRNGGDIELPFYWAISDQTDATFYERYMIDRGLLQGLEFRYVAENESTGTFLFDILSDKIDKKDLGNPEEADISPFERTNQTRYWLRSRADQALPFGVKARLDTDFVSDQDYLREFRGGLFGLEARPDLDEISNRPLEEAQSPTRRSALRLSRDGEIYTLQAISSYHQRPENPEKDQTPQPLAGLNFSLMHVTLPGLPIFFELESDYDNIWRETGLKGHSMSFKPEVSYPAWLGPYLELESKLNYEHNIQWLDGDQSAINRQTKNAYQSEVRLSTILERTFDFKRKDARNLKHKISPSLTYTYRSHKDRDQFRPWFESIDTEEDINRISFAFDNLFDAKKVNFKGEVSYTQWGTFSLVQGFDINEARREENPDQPEQPFEPLLGVLTLMPFSNLDFEAEAQWDHYRDDISFADLTLELEVDRSGGRKDSYQLDYYYEQGGSKGLNYSIDLNLVHGFSAGSSLRRDLRLRHSHETSYWLEYQSQCWAVRLIAGKLDEISSFMVTFNLFGLGDLGK